MAKLSKEELAKYRADKAERNKYRASYARCRRAAARFKGLWGWQKNHPISYLPAKDNGWHRRIAKELGWGIRVPNGHWAGSYENCKAKAAEFNSLKEWRVSHAASHKAACRDNKRWHLRIAKELGWRVPGEKAA